jgi:hypothetical protein
VLSGVEVLAQSEQADLWACEEVMESGWHTFARVGPALGQIRDARLL